MFSLKFPTLSDSLATVLLSKSFRGGTPLSRLLGSASVVGNFDMPSGLFKIVSVTYDGW